MHLPPRILGLLPLTLVALLGCEDAPTVPESIHRLAGGEEWVAVSAPVELPRLSGWLTHLPGATAEGREARVRVKELEHRSREAARVGRIATALALEAEAERLTVLSLERMPEPRLLRDALHSLDFWSARVRGSFDLARVPALATSLEEVEGGRVRAATHLAAGDTIAAVLEISAAAARIRGHAPETVALRVLERAEERIGVAVLAPGAAERAVHLLATARQELGGGDPRRALHRALYALQIVEGSEVRVVRSEGEPGCPAGEC